MKKSTIREGKQNRRALFLVGGTVLFLVGIAIFLAGCGSTAHNPDNPATWKNPRPNEPATEVKTEKPTTSVKTIEKPGHLKPKKYDIKHGNGSGVWFGWFIVNTDSKPPQVVFIRDPQKHTVFPLSKPGQWDNKRKAYVFAPPPRSMLLGGKVYVQKDGLVYTSLPLTKGCKTFSRTISQISVLKSCANNICGKLHRIYLAKFFDFEGNCCPHCKGKKPKQAPKKVPGL